MIQPEFKCTDEILSFTNAGELKAYLDSVPDGVLLFTESQEFYNSLSNGVGLRFDRIRNENGGFFKVSKYEGTFIGLCF